MAGATSKKPVNRKLMWVALVGLFMVALLAILVLSVRNPQAAREQKKEAARQAEIANQSTGSGEQATATLNELEKDLQRERDRKSKESETADRAGFNAMVGGEAASDSGMGLAGADGMPPIDADLARKLAAFDEVQRQVAPRAGASGAQARSTGAGAEDVGAGTGAGGGGWGSAGGKTKREFYENYDKDRGVASGTEGGDLFGGEANASGEEGDSRFETTKAKQAPSPYIINPGVPIPVLIGNRIDTRNGGEATGMITRTIYDSRTHRIPLIPQGSKVMLSFDTTVEPGVDRLNGQFKRIILPDGSIIELQSSNVASLDGSFGIPGKYKSNFARAIGPAFVVAAMGQYIEREFPEQTMTTREGTTYQTPSVMQQVAPKLSEQVGQRYQAAKPYFVIKPGTEVRLTVGEPLQFSGPAAGGAR